jgi:hypothetical protein
MEYSRAMDEMQAADIQALEAVAAWLKELGLGNGSDRLHKYICEIQKQAPPLPSMQELVEHGFAYLEGKEFISICTAYKGAEDTKLVAKLEKALKCCHTLIEESSKNSGPRNTMFELALAADLKLRGVDVELGEPDLIVNFPKGQYVIECKRPFKETSVRANVKEAESQLRVNLRPGQHGVIAISLSRIINPGTNLFMFEAGDRDANGVIHGKLQTGVHLKSCELMRDLATLRFSPNIAALMFDLQAPCITEKSAALSRASRFYPTDEPKWIIGKRHGFREISTAFTYLNNKMGDEVLNNEFSPEAKAEMDRMNRIAQMPAGVLSINVRE